MQDFPYTAAAVAQLEKAFTPYRLARYQQIAQGDSAQALRLYAWNTALSEAMFGAIQGLEVVLRNAIQQSLQQHFTVNWQIQPTFRGLLWKINN
ncbi:hypothetical protein [Thalassoporum mexicanum]|uniref:hypothetical protein n=1 Tax=Thalassoporum mexicanum TaxID=3457544 RepID=UPI0002DD49AA|nr:hypothetical protein [Pseudanabaena sp. PCC 7367]